MNNNLDINVIENKLLPINYRVAGFILILYVVSMALMTRIFTPEIYMLNTSPNLIFNQPINNVNMDNRLGLRIALVAQIPSASFKIAKNETKESHLNFPPFKGKKGEHVYHPIIQKASLQNNLDPALVKAVIMAESSYNPHAVSPVGAMGLMQLMPKTAESLGVQNSFNPEQNVQGGTKYLKELIDRLDGDVTLALAAYNAGLSHVLKYNGIPPFKATEDYVNKVYHYYAFYKSSEDDSETRKNINKDNDDQGAEEEA